MIIHGDDERKRIAAIDAAALAYVRLKHLRLPMYTGQGCLDRRLGVGFAVGTCAAA